MPAKRKLTDAQVRQIRRRHEKGEYLAALAVEFGVNRKTLRRRLDALERAESEKAMRRLESSHRHAVRRLRRRVAAERRKLRELEREFVLEQARARSESSNLRTRMRLAASDLHVLRTRTPPSQGAVAEAESLDIRLSGRALSEAVGLVRLRNSEGKVDAWVERGKVEALIDAGWSFA